MMTKKKRRLVLIIVVVVVLLMVAAIFLALYLNTDMFKSGKTLFVKYIGKNADNLKVLESIINETEYDEQLKSNPYNINIEAKANYTQNIGTTEENTDNSINQLKVTIEGQTDVNNQYDYRNAKLLKNDEQIAQIEYLHSASDYGIKFSDLFEEYVVSENTNLKDLFRRMGYSDEQLQNIPDSINLDTEIFKELKFSDEELSSLGQKYVGIISQNVADTNFSKQSNQNVNINGQNYIANAYILTLTKEQLNNIYVNLLENIAEDEIILSKFDIMQNRINELSLGKVSLNLREDIVNRIKLKIQKINQSNIGTDETKIIVYESNGQTLRTRVETKDYQTNIDYVMLNNETFAELSILDGDNEKYKITLSYNANSLSIDINDSENGTQILFKTNEQINNQTRNQNYDLEYKIDDKKININVVENTEIIQNLQNIKQFNNQSIVRLKDLNDTQLQEIINTLTSGLNSKVEEVKNQIAYNDIEKMLIEIELMRNTTVLGSDGITETEKNRFNSNFEIIQGENLETESVERFIQIIKNNISNMEVVSDNELRLTIERNQSNEEVVNMLTEFLENNGNNKYNISVHYDENGLVNQLILTIVEDNQE